MFDANQAVHDFYLVMSNAQEKSESPYTNNALRERIKARVMAGSEGGRPGQWSARKAQLVAARYRKAGGGYKKGKRPNKKQRSLKKWTREKWRTSDGKPALRGGKMRRYLPDKVWGRLSPAQRAATNRKKIQGDNRGQQFVANTDTAKDKAKKYRQSSKSLGETVGRTMGTIGNIGKLSSYDGDGDGFVTGPNGIDNVPTPLKIASDAVKGLSVRERGDALIAHIRKIDENGQQTDSVMKLAKAFNLGKEQVRKLVDGTSPEYFDRQKLFTEKLDAERTKFIKENDGMLLSDLARSLGMTVNQVSKFRVTKAGLGKRREIVNKRPKRVVKWGGQNVPVEKKEKDLVSINNFWSMGFTHAEIGRRLGLQPGVIQESIRQLEKRGTLKDRPSVEQAVINHALDGFTGVEISMQLRLTEDEVDKIIRDAGGLEGFERGKRVLDSERYVRRQQSFPFVGETRQEEVRRRLDKLENAKKRRAERRRERRKANNYSNDDTMP